jgi:ribosomal protein L7/L12
MTRVELTDGQKLRILEKILEYVAIDKPTNEDVDDLADDIKATAIVAFAMNRVEPPSKEPWQMFRDLSMAASKLTPWSVHESPVELSKEKLDETLLRCVGFAKTGRKLEAVKLLKEVTRAGLKECKEVIDII